MVREEMRSVVGKRHVLGLAGLFLAAIVGCGTWSSSTYWMDGSVVRGNMAAEQVTDMQTREIEHTFVCRANETLRIRNLAGTIELRQGEGSDVQVRATVYAKAATAEATSGMLDGMLWELQRDAEGRPEWTLTYPTAAYSSFHYSQSDSSGFEATSSQFGGRQVKISTARGGNRPSLHADLVITYPKDVPLAVRSMAGAVKGGELAGDVRVFALAGDVSVAGFDGALVIDTASGDVSLGEVNGDVAADTGSGTITVADLTGRGHFDTGSGDIDVKHAEADSVHADTGSGSIRVGSGSVGRIHADTGSGDVIVAGAEFTTFHGDTGSGDITIRSPLSHAERIVADTGSGDVEVFAGANASFTFTADTGSGDVTVRYIDATLRYDDEEIVGATRGEGKTRIMADTGSGDVTLAPGG